MVFIKDRICPTSVEHTVAGLQHKTIKILCTEIPGNQTKERSTVRNPTLTTQQKK